MGHTRGTLACALFALTGFVPAASAQKFPEKAQLRSRARPRAGGAGLFAPAGVRSDIVDSLNAEVVKGMNAPDTRAQLAKVELEAKTGTPAVFAKFVREETERWARVVKRANIRAE